MSDQLESYKKSFYDYQRMNPKKAMYPYKHHGKDIHAVFLDMYIYEEIKFVSQYERILMPDFCMCCTKKFDKTTRLSLVCFEDKNELWCKKCARKPDIILKRLNDR